MLLAVISWLLCLRCLLIVLLFRFEYYDCCRFCRCFIAMQERCNEVYRSKHEQDACSHFHFWLLSLCVCVGGEGKVDGPCCHAMTKKRKPSHNSEWQHEPANVKDPRTLFSFRCSQCSQKRSIYNKSNYSSRNEFTYLRYRSNHPQWPYNW